MIRIWISHAHNLEWHLVYKIVDSADQVDLKLNRIKIYSITSCGLFFSLPYRKVLHCFLFFSFFSFSLHLGQDVLPECCDGLVPLIQQYCCIFRIFLYFPHFPVLLYCNENKSDVFVILTMFCELNPVSNKSPNHAIKLARRYLNMYVFYPLDLTWMVDHSVFLLRKSPERARGGRTDDDAEVLTLDVSD